MFSKPLIAHKQMSRCIKKSTQKESAIEHHYMFLPHGALHAIQKFTQKFKGE